MAVFIDNLAVSIKLIRKHLKLLPIIAALDFVFLFLFGIESNFILKLASGSIAAVYETAANLGPQLMLAISEGTYPLSFFLSNEVISANLKSIMLFSLLFLAVTYLLWISINSFSWKLCYEFLNEKLNFKKYFKKFSILSLIWLIIFAVTLIIIVFLILIILLNPDPILSSAILQQISEAINIILVYFALISFSLFPYLSVKKNLAKTFSLGIKKILTFILVFAIICLVLYINFQITYLLFKLISTTSAVVLALITLIRFIIAAPFLTWARIYLILTAKKY